MRQLAVMLLFFILPLSRASADVISSYDSGSLLYLGEYGLGQQVRTPSGGPWNNIEFCFLSPASSCEQDFSGDPRYPGQPGRLFVLTQEYFGRVGELSSGTPGFVGISSALADSGWAFAGSLVLQPETLYYFYSDSILRGVGSGGPSTGYATIGQGCAGDLDCVFRAASANNYRLTGDPIPEPASSLLLAGGLGLSAFIRRRAGR
jgi:hypothetical protein